MTQMGCAHFIDMELETDLTHQCSWSSLKCKNPFVHGLKKATLPVGGVRNCRLLGTLPRMSRSMNNYCVLQPLWNTITAIIRCKTDLVFGTNSTSNTIMPFPPTLYPSFIQNLNLTITPLKYTLCPLSPRTELSS